MNLFSLSLLAFHVRKCLTFQRLTFWVCFHFQFGHSFTVWTQTIYALTSMES